MPSKVIIIHHGNPTNRIGSQSPLGDKFSNRTSRRRVDYFSQSIAPFDRRHLVNSWLIGGILQRNKYRVTITLVGVLRYNKDN